MMIRKTPQGNWILISDDLKPLGKYTSREEAESHMGKVGKRWLV
jgi:hypothetical protein